MVSYSLYIWHLVPLIYLGPVFWNMIISDYYTKSLFNVPSYMYLNLTCTEAITKVDNVYWCHLAIFVVCLTISLLVAALSYTCIEKPGMDVRKLYKNKYA